MSRLTTAIRRRCARRDARVAALEARLAKYETGWPPGHFYSPVPDLDEVRRRDAAIFRGSDAAVPGVDMREDAQLSLLRDLAPLGREQPWAATARPGLRYRFANPNFQQGEALVLYGLLRLLRPSRVIEVGSGWSSCALLDVNERFLDGTARCTFIEPYPELLRQLTPDDELDVLAVPVQDIDGDLFRELGDRDMLLVDSTHVAKVGSDVNHLLFDVLPSLAPGVYVHLHDIHHPFEYPRPWVYEGRAWNEAYLVHAFLMWNHAWEIAFSNSFVAGRHGEALARSLPPAAQSPGSSLWLRRNAP